MPLSGFHGVTSGFLVGIKQIIPDQELPFLKIMTKWLPSITLLLSVAVSFWTLEAAAYLPTIITGTYISWIYLRYWQTKPETKLRGDPSEDFAFSTFFPEFLRPVIDILHQYFTECSVEDLMLLMMFKVTLWEVNLCQVLTQLRHLGDEIKHSNNNSCSILVVIVLHKVTYHCH